MSLIEEGMTVYALKDLHEPATGDSPGGCLAKFGDKLIVRETDTFNGIKQYAVSHEHITDRAFYVVRSEISTMKHFNHNR